MFSKIKKYFKRRNTQKLANLPVYFQEAFALHNILMEFGIPEKDIYVAFKENYFQVVAYQYNENVIYSRDIKDTKKSFFVDIACLDMNIDTFIKEWTKAAEIYNNANVKERSDMIACTQSHKNVEFLITCMIAKGFTNAKIDAYLVEYKENLN